MDLPFFLDFEEVFLIHHTVFHNLHLYFYKDEGKDLKLINCGNYKRNDKTSELFLINNTDLTYLCSF